MTPWLPDREELAAIREALATLTTDVADLQERVSAIENRTDD